MTAEQIDAALVDGRTCRVATVGSDGWPYVVPLLYVLSGTEPWFHTVRGRGHFRRNVDHDARACLEVDVEGDVYGYGRFECDSSIAYDSVIAFGRIRIIDADAEKKRFFDAFMRKHAPQETGRPRGFYPRLDDVAVYAFAVERITGKRIALPSADNRWPRLDRTMSPDAVVPPAD